MKKLVSILCCLLFQGVGLAAPSSNVYSCQSSYFCRTTAECAPGHFVVPIGKAVTVSGTGTLSPTMTMALIPNKLYAACRSWGTQLRFLDCWYSEQQGSTQKFLTSGRVQPSLHTSFDLQLYSDKHYIIECERTQ